MKNILLLTISVLFTSIINAQWSEPSPVASNSQNVYAVLSDGTNTFAGTGSTGVSLSTNNGNSWNAVNNGMTSTGISAFAIEGTTIFAAGNGIFLSTNNGSLWTAVNNGLTNTTVNALIINGTTIYAGTNAGVYLSTNNGALWTAANTGFNGQVVTLAMSGTTIFAGAPNNGVYLSSNNGGLWTSVVTDLTNNDVHSLAISGTSIFAGTSGGVFLSTNNGTLWTAVNNGLTNLHVNSLLVNGSTIFAGTENGFFYSQNMGTNWTSLSDGFPANTNVYTLTTDGTYIFAGIHLAPYGVWRRPLSDILMGIENMSITQNMISVFPNPASDIVTLNSNINNEGTMTVNIYNVLGGLVKTDAMNQNQRQINVSDLSSGIYMFEIKSVNFSGKQKLIIQK